MSTVQNNVSGVYSSSANPSTAQWAWAHMLAHATSANMQPHQLRHSSHQYEQNNQHQQVVPTTHSQPPWFSSEQLHSSSWIPPPFQQSPHIQSIQSLTINSAAQFHHQSANSLRYRLNNRVVAPSAVSKTDFPDTTIVTQEKEKEQNDDVWGYLEAQAAFLGPSLWENSDLKVECLDLEEFLTENGIPLNDGNKGRSSTKEDVAHNKSSELPSTGRNTGNQKSDDSQPGPSNSPIQPESVKDVPSNDDESSSSSSGSSAYQSITPALVSPRATNRRKRISVSVASFNDNISDDGSYVPGLDFDPKNRSFSQEELRPQPMSKKSKKQYVPEDLKDDKYWARRNKNNMAAKRSRDARRSKENQIAMRAAFLEKENAVLKAELDKVTKLYAAALKRLEQYEKPGKK